MKSEDFSEQVNVSNYKVLEIDQDDLMLQERIRDLIIKQNLDIQNYSTKKSTVIIIS